MTIGAHPYRYDFLVVVELLVRVVYGLVVLVKHVVIEHAVGLGIEARSHGEVVDERLRGEHVAQVRWRGGRFAESYQVRRRVGPHVVGVEAVERHHQEHRVSSRGRLGRGQGRRDHAQRGHCSGRERQHDGGQRTTRCNAVTSVNGGRRWRPNGTDDERERGAPTE